MRHLSLIIGLFLTFIAPTSAEVILKGLARVEGKLIPFQSAANLSPGADMIISLKSDKEVTGVLTLKANGTKNKLADVSLMPNVNSTFPGRDKSIKLSNIGEYSFEFEGGDERVSLSVIISEEQGLSEKLKALKLDLSSKNRPLKSMDTGSYTSFSYADENIPDLREKYSAKVSTRSAGSKIYREYADSVVLILTDDGLGSGVRVSRDKILTNKHVVGEATKVMLVEKPENFNNNIEAGRRLTGTVIRYDEVKDLALIQVSAKLSGRVVKLANEREVEIAQKAHAIGHPRGEFWTYTQGVVSQIRDNYKWDAGDNKFRQANVIQTQTPINPGNSGGPLFTPKGTLMGINSFGSPTSPGLNFAVSYSSVKEFLASSNNVVAPSISQVNTNGRSSQKAGDGDIFDSCVETNNQRFPRLKLVCDVNGNGKIDLFIGEEEWKTAEGLVPVFMLFDENENGEGERKITVVPTKAGQKFTIVYFDTRETGQWTSIGYDYDNDGDIDEWAEM